MKKLLSLVLLAGLAFSPLAAVDAWGATRTQPITSHAKVTAHAQKAKAHKKLAAHRANTHKPLLHAGKTKIPPAAIHHK